MRTLVQLKEDREALEKRLGDMRALCANEERDPNDEELRVAGDLMDELDHIDVLIDNEERVRSLEDRSKKSRKKPDRTPIDEGDQAGDGRDRFKSGGEFLQAVMNAGLPGVRRFDPRLSTRAATGLGESIPSDGGFLVDQTLAATVMKETWESGMILPRINKMTLSGSVNGIKINGFDETSRADGSRAGGIRAYWKAEAAEKTASSPKFRQISLELNKLVGLCYATDELLQDANALEQAIVRGFTEEFNFKLQDAIINGTGAGQPLGILNAGCIVSVGKESGQAADTIVYQNILKMWSRLKADSRTNAVWLINQNCEPQLHQMSLAVGTGGAPVYLPPGGASASPYAILMGRPVVPVEQCPVLGDTGDIVLADFSKYVAADKGGVQQDVSMHVRFIYDESVFRFVYRFDGQPMLAAPITPYTAGATTATDTLSHFVKLDART